MCVQEIKRYFEVWRAKNGDDIHLYWCTRTNPNFCCHWFRPCMHGMFTMNFRKIKFWNFWIINLSLKRIISNNFVKFYNNQLCIVNWLTCLARPRLTTLLPPRSKVKSEAVCGCKLLMMGVEAPKTCWAIQNVK
jgi:hypothetical protein